MRKICVQGLGFVGCAMSVAIASSKNNLKVIGLERDNERGKSIVSKINKKIIPFKTTDSQLLNKFYSCVAKNFEATVNNKVLEEVDVVISNINLDLIYKGKKPNVDFDNIKKIYKTIGKKVKKGTLIVLETTVPPGTRKNIILPILKKEFKKRSFDEKDLNYVYSYERVMPGKEYLNSIKNFWRVYSSNNSNADRKFKKLCSLFINLEEFPMTKLEDLRSAETAKILENSYRATNIAFIQEWTEFSESLKINLFPIIDAIRMRPTHNNLMKPGLGVGGYCLTKDPLFGKISLNEFLPNRSFKNNFEFSTKAVISNNKMPNFSYKCILKKISSLKNKKVLFFGVTYKSDVQDTRHSPATILAKKLSKKGAKIFFNDDLSTEWNEIKNSKHFDSKKIVNFDIIIFNFETKISKAINFSSFQNFKGLIVDVSNSLSTLQQKQVKLLKIKHVFIGNFS